MLDKDIIKFVKQFWKLRKRSDIFRFHFLKKFSEKEFKSVLKETKFIGKNVHMQQRLWHIANNIYEIPICANEKCNNSVKYCIKRKKYRKHCSNSCINKSTQTKEKIKNTCIDKYNCINPMHNIEIANKQKTNLNKSCKKYKLRTTKRRKRTFQLRYGINHALQSEKFFSKCKKTSFLKKEYTLPSGKIIHLLGYENFGLDILLKQFNEKDIIYSTKEMNKIIGIIKYKFKNKNKIYYPDFYLPKENKIIEVKSRYTYKLHYKQNIKKKQTCINKGLLYEFWIFNGKGDLTIL